MTFYCEPILLFRFFLSMVKDWYGVEICADWIAITSNCVGIFQIMQNNLFTPLYDIANEGAVCALLRQLSGLDRSVKNSSALPNPIGRALL